MVENLRNRVIDILTTAQGGQHHHRKLIKTLQTILEQDAASVREFFDSFYPPFSNILLVQKREPAAERLIEFVAKLAIALTPERVNEENSSSSSSEGESSEVMENYFIYFLVAELMQAHNSKEKAVRFRVCQLLSKIVQLAYKEENAHIDVSSHLLVAISEVLLQRVYDKIPLVRVHSLLGLSDMQDITDPECPVTAAFLDLMEKDTSPDVRRCAVMHVVLSKTTLPAVIARTRDVKDAVRRSAFSVLSEKCMVQNFSIKQRIQLLGDGIRDRSEKVREACVSGLLRSWCHTLDGDFLNLLRRLDVESSSDIAELALMSLFEQILDEELVVSLESLMTPSKESELAQPLEEKNNSDEIAAASDVHEEQPHCLRVIPLSLLDCESCFYWQVLCKYFREKGLEGEECLERITPTLTHFCSYLDSFMQEMLLADGSKDSPVEDQLQLEFMAQQLLALLPSLDFSDEVGRRNLSQLVYNLVVCSDFPAALIPHLLSQQIIIWPQESYRMEKMIELIADMRHPGLSESALADSLSNVSYLELKDDVENLMKCLLVAGEMLKQLSMRRPSPILLTLVESLLLPCIQNENPCVRDLALSALGLACLLDVNLARSHILLFVQVSQVDHENVQATALKTVFDLIHVYGLEAFSSHSQQPGDSRASNDQTPAIGGSQEDSERGISKSPSVGGSQGTRDGANESCELEEEEGETDNREENKVDKTTQKILHILAEFLDRESALLRGIVGEGLAKLLLSGRIISQKLLVRLLLLWYNPALQDEDGLRSVLGVFFPTFATSDRDCRESLANAYLPTVNTILQAPPTSPLCDVEPSNVADFIVGLSAPLQPNEDSAHDGLALAVANFLLSDDSEDSLSLRTHCRALSQMKPTHTNKSNAADLLVLVDQLLRVIEDRASLRYLQKLRSVLIRIAPTRGGSRTEATSTASGRENDKENTNHLSSPSAHSDWEATPVQDSVDQEPHTPLSPVTNTLPLSPGPAPLSPLIGGSLTHAGGERSPGAMNNGSNIKEPSHTAGRTRRLRGRNRGSVLSNISGDESEGYIPPQSVRKSTKKQTAPRSTRKSTRKAKQSTGETVTESKATESDDSLLGEHSPFVRSTRSMRKKQLAQNLCFDEQKN